MTTAGCGPPAPRWLTPTTSPRASAPRPPWTCAPPISRPPATRSAGPATATHRRRPSSTWSPSGQTLTGLSIDAWAQTIPAAQISTGLAFHYDRPAATAPQALLVAVAPDITAARQPGAWDLDTLLGTVLSAAALASDRARAAELDPAAAVTLHDMP